MCPWDKPIRFFHLLIHFSFYHVSGCLLLIKENDESPLFIRFLRISICLHRYGHWVLIQPYTWIVGTMISNIGNIFCGRAHWQNWFIRIKYYNTYCYCSFDTLLHDLWWIKVCRKTTIVWIIHLQKKGLLPLLYNNGSIIHAR